MAWLKTALIGASFILSTDNIVSSSVELSSEFIIYIEALKRTIIQDIESDRKL